MSESEKTNSEIAKIIESWHTRSIVVKNAHYFAGNRYENWYLSLGIFVVAISAVMGSLEVIMPIEFLEKNNISPNLVKTISGLLSLFVAIVAGLQTFLKYSQRSERHRVAGAKYGEVERSLEEINVSLCESTDTAKMELHKIKKRMDDLASESPELPAAILKQYRIEIK